MGDTEETATDQPTRDAIMEATFTALTKHGYAGLTMQKIADEFDKSKSLLHYHYDTKDELLVALLDYMLGQLDERLALDEESDPLERLTTLVDMLLFGPDREAHKAFQTTLLELRAQAPYNEAFREQLTTNDAAIHDLFVDIVADGVEQGTFREVDPDAVATLVLSALQGARVRWVTLDEDDAPDELRDALFTYLVDELEPEDDA